MGVSGLQQFIKDHDCPHLIVPLRYKPSSATSNILVCDALSFVRTFYPESLDFLRCGQWDGVYARVKEFVEVVSRGGFVIHMIFDGVDEEIKEGVHDTRYRDRIRRMGSVGTGSSCVSSIHKESSSSASRHLGRCPLRPPTTRRRPPSATSCACCFTHSAWCVSRPLGRPTSMWRTMPTR